MVWGIFNEQVELKDGVAQIGGGLGNFLAFEVAVFTAQCINFPLQRNITFKSDGNPVIQAIWYFIGWVAISILVNAVWGFIGPVFEKLITDDSVINNLLKTFVTGGLSMFVFFFIFSGNMARIDVVRELFSALLEKSTLAVSAISCQFISNVPSAILLAQFSDNYRELLMGVNIGGCGTIISSLASLITFREYCEHNPGGGAKYLGVFSLFNFSFLAIMLAFAFLFV